MLLKVGGLTAGSAYQFRVYGANLIGLGDVSTSSAPFKCEAWTMPEPGNATCSHSFTSKILSLFTNFHVVEHLHAAVCSV